MRKGLTIQVICALLILLFVYTAASKLLDFEQFKVQLYAQTLPHGPATVLVWTLPASELLAAALLLSGWTRLTGLWLALLLMALFTGYVALVLLNFFGRVPCSCGGVIKALGWRMHLVLNVFFLLLTILAIGLNYRERRSGRKDR